MNIVLARTFLEILENGNFNKAAQRLNVTQSTVTMRVNALESIVGQQLFVRNRTGAELTSAGVKFRRYAELLVQVWQQAQQEIALPKDLSGTITIGVDPHLWEGPVESWLLWLRRELPELAVSARVGEPAALLRGLSHGLLDVVVEYNPHTRPGFCVEKIFDERLVLVSDTPRKRVKWHPLYVFVDWGEEFRKVHSVAFPDEQTPGVSVQHGRWALNFIMEYGGSGYFPLRLVERHLAEGRLFLVPESREFARVVHVGYAGKTRDSPWFAKALAGLHALSAPYAEPPRASPRLLVF